MLPDYKWIVAIGVKMTWISHQDPIRIIPIRIIPISIPSGTLPSGSHQENVAVCESNLGGEPGTWAGEQLCIIHAHTGDEVGKLGAASARGNHFWQH
eukprot:scaffold111165_cov20-Tisochrysis_lutea.AAC.3